MDRRTFMAAGLAALGATGTSPALGASPSPAATSLPKTRNFRALFPRLERDTYINAARGTPLSTFSAEALRGFEQYCQWGPGEGRGDAFFDMLDEIRGDFGRLIGAESTEIALTQCTKAGEHIVLQGLPKLRSGGNVVSNDFHFARSLHHLMGLKKSGHDVRIVSSRSWTVDIDDMSSAIDDDTALVAVTLVSNINGRFEPMRELADLAHRKGALVYADIIQAAGITPLDMRALGIDFAACSGYKWLFGVHGAAFFYVREEHQGKALEDHLYPGQLRHLYPPWTSSSSGDELYSYRAPTDARRYEPGHMSYLGFCGLHAGVKFILDLGVERLQTHTVELNRRLLSKVDLDRYPCISPDVDKSPIIAFTHSEGDALKKRLQQAGIAVTLSGNRIRVSPAIYNTAADIDRLASVLDQPSS